MENWAVLIIIHNGSIILLICTTIYYYAPTRDNWLGSRLSLLAQSCCDMIQISCNLSWNVEVIVHHGLYLAWGILAPILRIISPMTGNCNTCSWSSKICPPNYMPSSFMKPRATTSFSLIHDCACQNRIKVKLLCDFLQVCWKSIFVLWFSFKDNMSEDNLLCDFPSSIYMSEVNLLCDFPSKIYILKVNLLCHFLWGHQRS